MQNPLTINYIKYITNLPSSLTDETLIPNLNRVSQRRDYLCNKNLRDSTHLLLLQLADNINLIINKRDIS